jgi:putative SOS response-associated peptidase YedK
MGFNPFSWSKDQASGNSLINARSETVAEKPSFRSAFCHRRCIIPASGFFEWQKTEGKVKQPWYITSSDGGPLSFACLWEHWQSTRVGRALDGRHFRFAKLPTLTFPGMWRNESQASIYREIPKPHRCMGWSKIASMNSSEFTRNALPISTAFGDQSFAK